MKYLKPQKTSPVQIIFLISISIALASMSIAMDLANEIYQFFLSFVTVPTVRNLVNLIFVVQLGLLFFAYRNWHNSYRREKELSAVIEGINPDTLIITDSKGEIQMCSRSITRMFGYEVDELVGRPITAIIEPIMKDPDQLSWVIESMRSEGFGISLNNAFRKNNSEFPAEVISAELKGHHGQAVLIRDITERIDFQERIFQYNTKLEETVDERTRELQKTRDSLIREVAEHCHSKAELQNLSQFHQSVIDNASIWVSVYDPEKGIVLWNKAAKEISGYEEKEVTDLRDFIVKLYNEDYINIAKGRLFELMSMNKEINDLETQIRSKSGELKIMNWNTRNLTDENGKVTKVVYLGREITQEKYANAEAEKRLSEMKFLSESSLAFLKIRSEDDLFKFLANGLQELVPEAIIIINSFDSKSNEFHICNSVGIEPIVNFISEQVGLDILSCKFPINDPFAFQSLLSARLIRLPGSGDFKTLSFGLINEALSNELNQRFNVGDIYLIGFAWESEIYATANIILQNKTTLDNPGVIESFAHLGSVALRRIESEKELLSAKLSAEKANYAKTQFLANMSHEIRTPLNGLLGMTEIALRSQLISEQRENIRFAHESGKDLMRIVNNILDLSKIEAGEMKLAREEFSIREVVQSLHQKMVVLSKKKGLRFSISVSADIPDILIGDGFRLEQVLINLISNAIKFTDKGSVDLIVQSIPSEDQSKVKVKFSVIDTGIGIPKDKLGIIFESYQQADSSIKHKKGTGLGIAIAKSIVILMNGDIEVESEEGVGSDFHFIVDFDLQTEE